MGPGVTSSDLNLVKGKTVRVCEGVAGYTTIALFVLRAYLLREIVSQTKV